MDFTTFMHGFAASPEAPQPATGRGGGSDGSGGSDRSGERGRASRRRAANADSPSSGVRSGGARGDARAARERDAAAGGNDHQRHQQRQDRQRQQQQRWESGEPLTGQSMVATAVICVVVLAALPLLRMLFRLMALASLAALYLNNPARDASTHGRCWELLLNERRRRIAQRNSKDLGNFNVVRIFKNALSDTAGLLQGQRVMVDFVFFSAAYLDSEAEVDGEFFALGGMGSWTVVEMAVLRGMAAGVAATIDNAAAAAGMNNSNTESREQ